ncbi:MAG: hypothetical protein M0Z29_04470 [Actinomycetota bacterium]|nr:hypothetical protein [Actinomycetota bacterium]
MGKFRDILFARNAPAKANLDNLFAMPSAGITLEVSANLVSTGSAAVCFKPASGAAFQNTSQDFNSILEQMSSTKPPRESTDSLGYRWIIIDADDLESLTTEIHSVNSTLESNGFGPQLLCSVFPMRDKDGDRKVYLIYLYKRGTFYPFAPLGGEKRDNERELSLQALLKSDLPLESDLERWFPIWEMPL